MLLSSVILVLREVLEAAVLVSVLLALSLHLRVGLRWLAWAVPLALAGALLYAGALDEVDEIASARGRWRRGGRTFDDAALRLVVRLRSR